MRNAAAVFILSPLLSSSSSLLLNLLQDFFFFSYSFSFALPILCALPCSESLKFFLAHWTVLLFFTYSIAQVFSFCNMAICKKFTIIFCVKHRNCVKTPKTSLQAQKSCDIINLLGQSAGNVSCSFLFEFSPTCTYIEMRITQKWQRTQNILCHFPFM